MTEQMRVENMRLLTLHTTKRYFMRWKTFLVGKLAIICVSTSCKKTCSEKIIKIRTKEMR